MTQSPTPIHETVREHYAERIKSSASCCGSDNCCSPESNLYPADLLTTVPSDVSSTSYGCGDPITLASLQPGQTVLDLGSGAGLDCLLAAQKVGPEGRVIGVDMTPEMIERAKDNAKRVNATNVEFRQGYLEDIPVDSNTVDVVISNCVINLAPDKNKVFSEIMRVLKPGAKLAVSDIVTTDGPLPVEVKKSLSAWAGCIAGALDVREYKSMMEAAGLTDIELKPQYFDKAMIDDAVRDMKDIHELNQYSQDELYKSVFSAKISARKK
ncbi:MAG: arsenite methyltransferase [Anaerolineales bacterium]|nr:arsenite methyltransferase [Anaerolineales bacterium]